MQMSKIPKNTSSRWKHEHKIDFLSERDTLGITGKMCYSGGSASQLLVVLSETSQRNPHLLTSCPLTPDQAPVTLSVFVQMSDCSRVSLGVGFTLPVRELEETGETPRSARGIHLRSTSLLTVLNLVIKYDAELVMFYEKSAVWFLISPQSFQKEMKEVVWWKCENQASDSLKDLQSDGGNMGNIRTPLSLIEWVTIKSKLNDLMRFIGVK